MKVTFVRSVGTSAVSTTDEVLELPATGNPRLSCYDRISAINKTHDVTSVHIGFKSGSREFIVAGKLAPGANVPFGVEGKIFVPGGYRPFVRYVGATAGDLIELVCFGYDTDNPE